MKDNQQPGFWSTAWDMLTNWEEPKTAQPNAAKRQTTAAQQPQTLQPRVPLANPANAQKPKDQRHPVDIVLPLVAGWEKFVPEAYLDTVAKTPVWTVGYGTVRRTDGRMVAQGDRMTEEEARAEMRARLQQGYDKLSARYPGFRKLNPRQQAAILDIEYNVGNFPEKYDTTNSLLLSPNPDVSAIGREIPTFRMSGKNVVEGLVNRRGDTLDLFNAPEGYEAQRRR